MAGLQRECIPFLKSCRMISFRKANEQDVQLFFDWANDELVRANSFNQQPIIFENHVKWFNEKIKDEDFIFLVFVNENKEAIGQVRFQKKNGNAVVGILIDKHHRGKGYAVQLLTMASDFFHQQYAQFQIYAFVKTNNLASYHSFLKAGYVLEDKILYNGKDESFKLVRYK